MTTQDWTIQDWTRLKEDAQELLDGLDLSKLTKSGFIALGSCTAILDHVVPSEDYSEPTPQTATQATPASTQVKPPVTVEKLKEIVKEEIQGIEMYTDMQEFEIAAQEAEHAIYFLSKLKAQAASPEDKAAVRELWSHLNLAKHKLK